MHISKKIFLKIYTLILSSIVTLSLNAQSVEGTWKLAPQA